MKLFFSRKNIAFSPFFKKPTHFSRISIEDTRISIEDTRISIENTRISIENTRTSSHG